MTADLRDAALNSNVWAFQEASNVARRRYAEESRGQAMLLRARVYQPENNLMIAEADELVSRADAVLARGGRISCDPNARPELMRDQAAEHYERQIGKPWLPRSGSKVNHRNLTSAMIDSRDFLV